MAWASRSVGALQRAGGPPGSDDGLTPPVPIYIVGVLKVLCAAVALTIVTPVATAQAGWRDRRATEIARIVWHHPCVDQMVIRRASAATVLGDPDTLGWVAGGCVVYISDDRPTLWVEFCTRVLHEAGHLANYRDPSNTADPLHSANPDSVMYAIDDRTYGRALVGRHWVEAGGDPRCADHGRPYLERHGALRRGRADRGGR